MRLNQLTFFRFLAAILVVAFHFGRETFPFNLPTSALFVEILSSMVSFFFLLSGFVLAVSNFDKAKILKKEFYFNRFIRIYPLYIIALLVYFLSRGLNDISAKELIMNLSLTQALFSDNALSLNYPGWSLSAEACFYLLFPFVFSLLMQKTSKLIAIICGAFWVLSMSVYALSLDVWQIPISYATYFPAYHLSTFVLGVGAGLVFCRHKEVINQMKTYLCWTTVALAGTAIALVLLKSPIIRYHHSGLFNPLFLSTILLFSIECAPLKALLSSRILVFLGEISYGIYILQYSLWCLFFSVAGRLNLALLTNFYVCTAALIAGSAGSYFLIEKPAVFYFKTWRRGSKQTQQVDSLELVTSVN